MRYPIRIGIEFRGVQIVNLELVPSIEDWLDTIFFLDDIKPNLNVATQLVRSQVTFLLNI